MSEQLIPSNQHRASHVSTASNTGATYMMRSRSFSPLSQNNRNCATCRAKCWRHGALLMVGHNQQSNARRNPRVHERTVCIFCATSIEYEAKTRIHEHNQTSACVYACVRLHATVEVNVFQHTGKQHSAPVCTACR